jgi:hypothetical protein
VDSQRTFALLALIVSGCSISPGTASPFGGSDDPGSTQDGGVATGAEDATATTTGNATASHSTTGTTGDASSSGGADADATDPSGVDSNAQTGSQASSDGAGDDAGEGVDGDGIDEEGGGAGADAAEEGSGVCGDGVIDLFEDCEGQDLDGATCESFGFLDGALVCDPKACWFDFSGCSGLASCGDGVIDMEFGESCDGEAFGGETCASEGFSGGTLICDPIDCYVDYSQCEP